MTSLKVSHFIIVFILSILISCDSEINNDENTIISENPYLTISTNSNQSDVSRLEDIYITVYNFSKIWKVYLAITNNQSIAFEDRILLDTTSTSDSVSYKTTWNTSLFPNGNYDLFAELIDSTNQRVIATKVFSVINYNTLKIINEHETTINYLINSNKGLLFSNSITHIQLENSFNEMTLQCAIEILPCGTPLSYNFSIIPGNIENPIIVRPDSNVFFLRAQNKSIENNFINSITIRTNENLEECNNLSILNDDQIYSLGYFNLNNDLYQQGEIEILTTYGNSLDTTKLSFFNEAILIDTLIIN